jgi:dihydropteroate synthase
MKPMPFKLRSRYDWKLRTTTLSLGIRTLVMGILNVTPDSFSDGGLFLNAPSAIEGALAMFDEGADIVDVGGESTRPGKRDPISTQEEIDRILPVLQGVLQRRPKSILSVDTYRGVTAAAALQAGVQIVNDVSGLQWDREMAQICADAGCGVVMMHTRGRPEDWHALPPMQPNQLTGELHDRLNHALQAGIQREHLVLDPGFGFGKRYDENYQVFEELETLAALRLPLLAGVSRKGFLGRTLAPLYQGTDAPIDFRENATLAATTATILAGAHVVRVHNVRPAKEAAAITDAILAASEDRHPPRQ